VARNALPKFGKGIFSWRTRGIGDLATYGAVPPLRFAGIRLNPGSGKAWAWLLLSLRITFEAYDDMPSCTSALSRSESQAPLRQEGTVLEGCYRRAGKLAPWFGWISATLWAGGLYLVFSVAPADPGRGEHYRIAFIHGPATWISMLIYVLMVTAAATELRTRQRLASMLASALAPTGAMFAFISLWTGSLLGKPVWGVWWVWDARLTSELLLLFLFLGFIALKEAIDDTGRADRATGVLALVGLVGLPLLYFSVHWWRSRQGVPIPDVRIDGGGGVTAAIVMLTISLSLACYTVAAALTRLRIVILERERGSAWVSSGRV